MKTVYFRLVLVALAAAAGAAVTYFPQYAEVLKAVAAVLTGVAIPAESVQKAMKMAPRIVPLAVLTAFALPSAGCAEFGSIVHEVLEYSNEAQALFSALRAAYEFFVTTSGVNIDADTKAKIEQAFSTTAIALNAAVTATQGVDGLAQGDLDAAFADFKTAVQNLIDLLDKVGATQSLARGVGSGPRTAVLSVDNRLIRIPVAFQK